MSELVKKIQGFKFCKVFVEVVIFVGFGIIMGVLVGFVLVKRCKVEIVKVNGGVFMECVMSLVFGNSIVKLKMISF